MKHFQAQTSRGGRVALGLKGHTEVLQRNQGCWSWLESQGQAWGRHMSPGRCVEGAGAVDRGRSRDQGFSWRQENLSHS